MAGARTSGASAVIVGDRSVTGRSTLSAYFPIAVAAALLATVPIFIGDSRTYMGIAVGVLTFAGYAVAFNVIFGATAQLFLCLGALAGVAGYGTTLLADDVGLPLLISIPVAAAMSAVVGGIFSWVSVRRGLDVIFIGIVTLTFALGFTSLLLGQRSLTGGETGRVVEAGGGTLLRELVPGYYVFLAVLTLFLVTYRWLQRSHFGWAFRALRDDETTAELAGVDVARYRIWAGVMGSAMLGVMGALFAHHEGFVSPSTFAFHHVDVRTLVILAFGGIGTLMGPIIGAVSFGVVDEWLRDFGRLRIGVYGAVLLTLFLGFRGGVGPAVVSLYHRVRRRVQRS